MSRATVLDCGCYIAAGGGRTWCPTCAGGGRSTASADVVHAFGDRALHASELAADIGGFRVIGCHDTVWLAGPRHRGLTRADVEALVAVLDLWLEDGRR